MANISTTIARVSRPSPATKKQEIRFFPERLAIAPSHVAHAFLQLWNGNISCPASPFPMAEKYLRKKVLLSAPYPEAAASALSSTAKPLPFLRLMPGREKKLPARGIWCCPCKPVIKRYQGYKPLDYPWKSGPRLSPSIAPRKKMMLLLSESTSHYHFMWKVIAIIPVRTKQW